MKSSLKLKSRVVDDINKNGKFIPNTNKRYTITEEGIVYSHYRYNNKGKKFFRIKEIRKHLNNGENKTFVVSLMFGKYSQTNKLKGIYVNTLMEKCFSLKPPDKFHLYQLSYKDGNPLNLRLDNLEYRIRTLSNHKFYPQPFYNLSNKITHKVCGECGNKKEIVNFSLQNPKEKGQNRTYRNICESCRSKIQWAKIKSDIKKLKASYLHGKRWAQTEIGKKYYQDYRKNYSRYERENLADHYLATTLRMNQKDLTPELIELTKKKLLLFRKVKNIKQLSK
jgi:hypothetical protein